MFISFEYYIVGLENQAKSIFNLALELECIKSFPDENNKPSFFIYETNRKFEKVNGIHKSNVENLMQIIIDQSRYFDDQSVVYGFNLFTYFFEFYNDLNSYEKSYFNGFLSFKMKSLQGYINEIESKKFIERIPEDYHILGKRIVVRNFEWILFCYMFFSIELSKLKPVKNLESYNWNKEHKDKLAQFYENFKQYFKKDITLKEFKDSFSQKPLKEIKAIKINTKELSGIDLVYLLQTLMDKTYITKETNFSWQRFNAIFKDFSGNDINTNSLKSQKSNLENDYSEKSIQKVESIIP